MFGYLTISLFITITSAIPTGREDIVYPTVETLRSGIKRIKFRAINQDIELSLKPAGELISDDFVIYEGEHERKQPTEKIKNIKKNLYRDSEKGAALHIEEDGFTTIHGIISKKLRIKPEETIKEGRRAHRVFEVENTEKGRFRTNDAIIPPGKRGNNATGTERKAGNCIIIEITIVSDKAFTNRFISNGYYDEFYHMLYLKVTICEVQNLMDTMKLKSFKLKVVLKGVIVYNNKYEAPFFGWSVICDEYFDSGELIDNMAWYYSEYGTKLPPIVNADVVMCVTGGIMADIYGDKCYQGTVGIAYVGGCCDPGYKYGISQDDTSDLYEYCHTFAHELAHLIACPHDGDPPVSYIPGNPGTERCEWDFGHIMSYKTNEQNGTKFSPCSSECVQHFASLSMASCIIEICFE
uniref:Metalloproteinase n=1 Tax=Centruroides hentzi TaxID=88313 RepID=A0A2I9LP79_9SCOR